MKTKIVKLNLEGETCPYPLMKCIEKFREIKNELKSGSKVLKVKIDCPAALENIPLAFKKKGFQTEIKEINKGKWEIIIKSSPEKLSSKMKENKEFKIEGNIRFIY